MSKKFIDGLKRCLSNKSDKIEGEKMNADKKPYYLRQCELNRKTGEFSFESFEGERVSDTLFDIHITDVMCFINYSKLDVSDDIAKELLINAIIELNNKVILENDRLIGLLKNEKEKTNKENS